MKIRVRKGKASRAVRGTIAVMAIGLLFGCAGGGSDGGVGLASDGQSPDPVVLDFPIAYVQRPVIDDPDMMLPQPDIRELITFELGANLFVRDRASPSTDDVNVTLDVLGDLGDVKDVEISYEGDKVIFAMRGPADEGIDLDDEDQPTWNIWEYEITTATLRRVITSDITAEAGHDLSPHYLPDSRIIFTSTRQRQSSAILLDEGKPQFPALDEDRNEPAFLLHVMNSDGSDVHQVSFNQSHDTDPSVLANGQIVFSRWDNYGNNAIHLYKMDPDGTDLELLYGSMSHDTGTNGDEVHFLQAREHPDGQLLALLKPFSGTDDGGDIIFIDTNNYVENTQPLAANSGVLTGPAQSPATNNNIITGTPLSPGGRYKNAFPLWDGTNRVFVSWSQCRLLETDAQGVEIIVPCTTERLADPNAVPADPLYGIWLYDVNQNTQLPVVPPVEGTLVTEIVASQPRPLPPVLFDDDGSGFTLDQNLLLENVGVLHIRSVYDLDGVDSAPGGIATVSDPTQTPSAQRPARFLKLVKAVSMPDEDIFDFDNTAFGRSAAQGMKEILGYAPIEPDGSVMVKVPANVAFTISVLDAQGRRITPRHENWMQMRPGQLMECNGCHVPDQGTSHGRVASYDSVYAGATADGLAFPNTNPAIFADFGETMAEARARVSCATDSCNALSPSVHLIFDDVWTDPAVQAPDVSFAYRYTDLGTQAPTTVGCLASWSNLCRITINYVDHIHPLWELPRQIIDPNDGVTVLQDNTCTLCHNDRDVAGMIMLPEGQLELTGAPSPDEADHLISYRELLFGDNEEFFDVTTMTLMDVTIDVGIDPVTGLPITQTVPVAPSMSVNGANALLSQTFFSRFAVGGTHAGYLTDAELRLISEWLDIGGQYYNNPFDAPEQ